jgi:hypothetical protein
MTFSSHRLRILAVTIATCALSSLLAGCGGNGTTPPPPPPPPPPGAGVTFNGKAMAGTQPINGATIQLYAIGVTGNGSASTALLSTTLTTDATGAFTVPAGYSCPSTSSQLYLTAAGGKVGLATDNSAITLAAVLGACNQITTSTQVVINEVTTTATAWALSQFLTASANLGASATNSQGLINAIATANNLANMSTGASPGSAFPSTGTSPAGRINTIANLLNTCTTAVTSTSCSQLFAATTSANGTAPTNTFAAALNLARNPGISVTALYAQSAASSAFSPALSSAPADWSLWINYTGGGLSSPGTLGVDSTGNIWVANYCQSALCPNATGGFPSVVSEFASTGAPVSVTGYTGGGLAQSYGLAIDAQDNIWITNEGSPSANNCTAGSVTELNSSGQPISGTNGYTAGEFNCPIAIAIDTNSTAWAVNNGNAHLTVLSTTSGQPLSGTTGYPGSGTLDPLAFPSAVALDASHNAWIGNQSSTFITKVSPDGSQFTNFSCCNGAGGVAIDQAGNVWVANYYGDSVSELSNTGAVISTGYTDSTLDRPQGIAIDGSGNVWVSNFLGSSITELAGANATTPGKILSPSTGFASDANLLEAYSIAVDASGNLWVTNFGNDTLTELVGIAAPVKTPLLGVPQAP